MDYSDKNGIQVVIDEDKQVARLFMFLDGEYKTWVEFNETQLNNLISELEDARDSLKVNA
jgi:hypothetical protein